MTDLFVLFGGFAASACAIELLVARKLHTAVGRVIAIHLIGLSAALYFMRTVDVAAALVCWSGLFVAWFGIRSHIESSILLRILYFLRGGPLTRDEILGCYDREYGRAIRIDDLVKAGLLSRRSHEIALTARGRAVARLAALLR
jgi:hypothetical protein